MELLIYGTLIGLLILSIIAIVKGFMRKIVSTFWLLTILAGASYSNANGLKTPTDLVNHVVSKFSGEIKSQLPTPTEQPASTEQPTVQPASEYFVERLTGTEQSNVTNGSVKWGATIVLGDLDNGRASWGHILVSDSQEPGQNGEKRESRLTYNPKGWRNYKLSTGYTFNRGHGIGYQFSGLGDEPRNLATLTAYANKGTEGNGSNQNNTEGMLYYEQRLDSWLATHPNFKLDYYTRFLYNEGDTTPYAIYMQWVGVDSNDNTIPIQIGGNSKELYEDYQFVIVSNSSPSFTVDYTSDPVTVN